MPQSPNSSPSRSSLLAAKSKDKSFAEAVEDRVRESQSKDSLFEQLDQAVRTTHGVAGGAGLELFAKGKGMRFFYGEDGTPISEVSGDDKKDYLEIDGEVVDPKSTRGFREYLSRKYGAK
jgi:hypothetical protein